MIPPLIISALFSLIFPLGKIALAYCSPFFLTALRMFLGGAILLLYRLIFKKTQTEKFSYIYFLQIVVLAIFNIYLTNAYEFWGLQYMSSSKTAFIYNLSPFFAALFAYWYFNERMTTKKWIGLIISFIGFLPIFLADAPAEKNLSHLFSFSTAELALLIATVATVYGWIVMQNVVRQKHDPVMANGLSMLGGAVISLLHSVFVETWHPTPVISWWPFLGWLVLIVFFSNIVCYSLYAYSLKKYTATFVTFAGLTGPLFAALFDWLFFGISVSWDFYLATALVCGGLYLFYQEEMRLGYIVKKAH
ncbi:MAG: DMT family transporter [Candidatus Babeliaceae bacterium]